ncbi:MAG: patatin-like phospholipase family protein [Acidimicrobiia bacterium]
MTAVFEGGGVKGIALAGAAAAAMERGIRLTSAVGTSAGALVASLVVAGYGPDDLERIVCEMPWSRITDRRPLARIPVVGPHIAMLTSGGVARGRRLEREVFRLLARRDVRVFGDLPPGALRVVATDLVHGRGVVLPDDLPQYGIDPVRFPVARAVRASSAVPFVFEPVIIRSQATGEEIVLADGALAARFPLQLVEPGTPTLGFRLTPTDELHEDHRIRGPLSLARSVVAAGMTARESLPVLCRDLGSTIAIQVDRAPLDFDLDANEANAMFRRAHHEALDQLDSIRL